MTIDVERIVRSVDHTLLRTDATIEEIRKLCDEAVKYQTASVCIPPAYADEAVAYLAKKAQEAADAGDEKRAKPVPVCVVIGFPNGYSTAASKAFETRDAIRRGVSEIDTVINVGFVKNGRYDAILEELRQIREAAGNHVMKVIIETCLLTQEEKIRMCDIVMRSGADFIKTSTGFSRSGATPEDVKFLAEHVGPGVRVKAAGGIHTLEEAQNYLDLGASRLGTSSIIKLLEEKN